jgi:selenocysteine-specific elongation factor
VTVRDGAPLIVRSDNAKETLGGGAVVALLDAPIGRRAKARHERLARWEHALGSAEERLRAAIELDGAASAAALATRCQLRRDAAQTLLDAMRERGELLVLPGGAFIPAAAVADAADALRRSLTEMHARNPLLAALPIADVRDAAAVSEQVLAAALERLGDEVVVEARTVRLASHTVSVDPELTRTADAVLTCLGDARFAPPAADKLPAETGLDAGAVERALTFLRDQRSLREVAPGILYPKTLLDEGLRLLHAVAAKRGDGFEPVDAKAVLGGISRKWLIPLLEYYDRIGATRRDGNARRLTRRGEAMVEAGIDAAG